MRGWQRRASSVVVSVPVSACTHNTRRPLPVLSESWWGVDQPPEHEVAQRQAQCRRCAVSRPASLSPSSSPRRGEDVRTMICPESRACSISSQAQTQFPSPSPLARYPSNCRPPRRGAARLPRAPLASRFQGVAVLSLSLSLPDSPPPLPSGSHPAPPETSFFVNAPSFASQHGLRPGQK
jgi:hypothetical protein